MSIWINGCYYCSLLSHYSSPSQNYAAALLVHPYANFYFLYDVTHIVTIQFLWADFSFFIFALDCLILFLIIGFATELVPTLFFLFSTHIQLITILLIVAILNHLYLWLQALVYYFKLNYFFFKLSKFRFELVSFFFCKLNFSFNSTVEAFSFFLYLNLFTFKSEIYLCKDSFLRFTSFSYSSNPLIIELLCTSNYKNC